MPAQRILYWLTVICVIGLTLLQKNLWRSLGLAPARAWSASWIVVSALALAALAVVIAKFVGTFHALPHFGNVPWHLRVGGYVVWSFLQEFLLQIYVLMRLMRLIPRRSIAIAAAALLFAVAHIPNPVLGALTLVGGFIACPLFLRYRNLYALGLAHAILCLCGAVTVPEAKADGRPTQRRRAPHSPRKEILHPPAKEELFRQPNQKLRKQPHGR